MNNNSGVKLTRSAARRLVDAGRYVEQQPRSEAPRIAPPVDFGGGVMLLVTTACNPMSGPTPGKNGRGKIQKLDGSGNYSDLSSTVYPIINDTEKTVAVGAYVMCISAYGKYHWLGVDKCANLS